MIDMLSCALLPPRLEVEEDVPRTPDRKEEVPERGHRSKDRTHSHQGQRGIDDDHVDNEPLGPLFQRATLPET